MGTRTSKALADAMWDELENLTQGKSTPQQARAKAALANVICGVARLEMDFSRFVADARAKPGAIESDTNALPALSMGTTLEAQAA